MIKVALGLLIADDKILLMQRLREPYKGSWELPGGKIEANESSAQCLLRELHEELGIVVTDYIWLNNFLYHYPSYSADLDVYIIKAFNGVVSNKLGQPLAWVANNDLDSYLALPATLEIVKFYNSPITI